MCSTRSNPSLSLLPSRHHCSYLVNIHFFVSRPTKFPIDWLGSEHTILCWKIALFKQIKIVLPITSPLDATHLVFKIWAYILPEPPHATIYHQHHTFTPTSPMNPSRRIRRRAPQRQLRDPNQTLSGRSWHESSSSRLRLIAILTELESPRRSSRLQSRQLRTCYEPRSPFEHPPSPGHPNSTSKPKSGKLLIYTALHQILLFRVIPCS
jgi:hypothetical protein